MQNHGIVFLVGAGPGDPDYLTVKAHRLLSEADVVVYDRLVSDEIMDLIPSGTARVNVGKQSGCWTIPQEEINNLLVSLATEKRCIVRLKGGDPFFFGRGGEEADYLKEHGITCHVVPGITSANGCAASLGLPLTKRGLSSGVRFVTGHMRENLDLDLDWKGMADPDTTLVIYMGLSNMPQIAVRLITNGLSPMTGALAVSNGTRINQDYVASTLGEIAHDAAERDWEGPVLFIVGRVVDGFEGQRMPLGLLEHAGNVRAIGSA
ncbi:MAG: uroporphyrinogen-III C-methyltransferase [Rhodospirillales bacterium]|nr:uroporphyrinogen-III C-methyltransferase [Rhodospirillales bacterium]